MRLLAFVVALGAFYELAEWVERHYPTDTPFPADAREAAAWAALVGLGFALYWIPRIGDDR